VKIKSTGKKPFVWGWKISANPAGKKALAVIMVKRG
jgi:hypothetical protein